MKIRWVRIRVRLLRISAIPEDNASSKCLVLIRVSIHDLYRCFILPSHLALQLLISVLATFLMTMEPHRENTKFEGWIAHNRAAAAGQMEWGFFEPKPWEETDVDIEVTHCGICSSDLHVLRSDWPASYPVVVGHEIIGTVVRVGMDVKTGIRVGDRVGVGAQSDACLCRKPPAVADDWSSCGECATGKENYCARASTTYNSHFLSTAAGGAKTMGGYARHHRCPSHFVFKIPKDLRSEYAAPLMCAGITVYSALCSVSRSSDEPGGGSSKRRHLRGTRVGVIGIGGLGHLAILFARAMGAEYVLALSRDEGKRDDARTLGADEYIATGEEEEWGGDQTNSLHVMISTIATSAPIDRHLRLLRRGGRYIALGMPRDAVEVDVSMLVVKGLLLTGSLIGSPAEVRDMLQFAMEQKITPRVDVKSMGDANNAILDMEAGMARYRFVLCNEM